MLNAGGLGSTASTLRKQAAYLTVYTPILAPTSTNIPFKSGSKPISCFAFVIRQSRASSRISSNAPVEIRIEGNARFEVANFAGGGFFNSATFESGASFESATFEGARFGSASFKGDASFASATFSLNTSFVSATFEGDASFDSASFKSEALFDSATYSGDARFDSATFNSNTSFVGSAFNGDASFVKVIFSSSCWFEGAAFSGDAWFGSATFPGDASFASATFSKATSFASAKFQSKDKSANFTAIKVERAFDLSGASFLRVPNFSQVDFKQAPDLDAVRFPRPAFWNAGKTALIPLYRALRRMAIQGADYEREHMAFKGELRSRRGTIDNLWHPGLWLGLFYDGVADCGRSVIRPFLLWAASVFGFALYYLHKAIESTPDAWRECLTKSGDPWAKALYASGRNALVLTSGRDARVDQAYRCLFGPSDDKLPVSIPDTVSFVEFFMQVPLSAVLIFLFLLAVKNRFKIK